MPHTPRYVACLSFHISFKTLSTFETHRIWLIPIGYMKFPTWSHQLLHWEETLVSISSLFLYNLLLNDLSELTNFTTILFTGVEMNDQLLGSQLLACTLSSNTLCGEATSDLMMKPDGPYDFYQHPNVAEARQCQPVLQGLSEAVSQLLQDWPEHPVLEQVV